MKGLVIKNTGSWYQVKNVDNELITECKIKGNLRLKDIKSTNPVAVGDIVYFSISPDGTGLISEIEDRRNYVIRKSSNLSKQSHILAANIDLSALVVTVNYPPTSTVFIDRFLASCEAYRVPACIIFNKIDLYSAQETEYLDALLFLYENIGYPVFKVSAVTRENIPILAEFLKNKTTLFSGNSGAGKSTIINELIPGIQLRTGQISDYHNRGMHTTTFSEMFDMPLGGYVIDTPGIKGFGTYDMTKYEVSHYFKEIFYFSKNCRYSNCTHFHEPDCAVRKALEENFISQSRFQSYLSMLSDLNEGKYRTQNY
jgi:ribosome biogenesis GTPase